MIFDEHNRNTKLLIEIEKIKPLNSQQSLDIFFDMNNAILKICKESIKSQHKRISKKGLLKEIKRVYSLRE